MAGSKTIKSALESLMFTWGEPLSYKSAAEALGEDPQAVLDCFRELMTEYEQESRGIRIREVNKSFQFVTFGDNADYISRLCTPVKIRKLTQSALEVLAIIAYKQPVTKAEIESIRGVRCDRVLDGLRQKELVEDKGRSQAIGRPLLYGTTDKFLKQFGFTTINDLPEIDDIESAIEARDEEYEDAVTMQQISMESLAEGMEEE